MRGNIYLVGFMGTGKSAVGKELARRLGRPLVDSDAAIERRAGLPISDIFARRGQSWFRRLESQVVAGLARRRGIVAALGGGVLLSPANRKLLERSGVLVALTCSRRELWRRLKKHLGQRPLLAQGQRGFIALRRKRQGLEAGAAMRCSTTGRSAATAAQSIARRLRRRSLA